MNDEELNVTAFKLFSDANDKQSDYVDFTNTDNVKMRVEVTVIANSAFINKIWNTAYTRFYLTVSPNNSKYNIPKYTEQSFFEISDVNREKYKGIYIFTFIYGIKFRSKIENSAINSFNLNFSYAHLSKQELEASDSDKEVIGRKLIENTVFETKIIARRNNNE